MRMTQKGQVTIPQDLREKAGLLPDTEVEFALRGTDVIIRRARKPTGETRGQRIVRRMREIGARQRSKLTTDEIMRMTRGDE